MSSNKNDRLGVKETKIKKEYIDLLESYLNLRYQKIQSSLKLDKKQYKKFCEEKNANLKLSDFKIIKNHTLNEYFDKYQNAFTKGKVSAYLKDELFLLSEEKTYWEIHYKTETFYFEIPSMKKFFLPIMIFLGVGAIAGASVGIYFAVKSNPPKGEEVNVTCLTEGVTISAPKAIIGQDYNAVIGIDEPTTSKGYVLPSELTKVTSGDNEVKVGEYTYTLKDENKKADFKIPSQYIKGDVTIDLTLVSPPSPYKDEPLTFTCVDGGNDGKASIGLLIYNNAGQVTRNLKYRINNGPWKPIKGADDKGDFKIVDSSETRDVLQDGDTLSKDDKIQFIGDNATFSAGDPTTTEIITNLSFYTDSTYEPDDDDTFNLSGNVMSLLSSDDFMNLDKINEPFCFNALFSDYMGSAGTIFNYIEARDLCLPANTLSDFCYDSMFKYCETLLSVPTLPANNLAVGCYYGMFFSCPKLKSVQEILPAMELKYGCYYSMFYGCSGLEIAPELPANNLADYCYTGMFSECSSLKSVQEILPAMILKPYCYNAMFNACSVLEIAPVLPANNLADDCEYCYYSMFSDCTKLEYLKVGFGENDIWPDSNTTTPFWLSSAGSQVTTPKKPKFYWAGNNDSDREIVAKDYNHVPDGWEVLHY